MRAGTDEGRTMIERPLQLVNVEVDQRWPQLMADLVDISEASARQILDEETARKVSRMIVAHICEHLGGEQLYFPRGDSIRTGLLHQEIWDAYNGSNKIMLCRRFNLSIRQIERILADQGRLHRDRFQGQLFEPHS